MPLSLETTSMQLILQRVSRASVVVDSETVASIARGVLLLVAIETGDTLAEVGKAARKVASLRMFDDSRGHMNLDPRQAEAAFLVVSQFTLAASLDRGRRPSFNGAAVFRPVLNRRLIVEMTCCGTGRPETIGLLK